MATSYSNIGGSGNRTGLISVSADIGLSGDPNVLIKEEGNLFFLPDAAPTEGKYIKFDFGTSLIIDEATWYQTSDLENNGTWKWQGSANDSNWVDIGSSFIIAAATEQTFTQLNGNTTAYRYYRLLGVSGVVRYFAYLIKIHFKISQPEANNTYYSVYSIGDRTSIITTSNSSSTFAIGTLSKTVDGTYNNDLYFSGGISVEDKWLKFDFNSNTNNSICITEAKFYQQNTSSHGVWKWQGSDDDSTWSDIGSSFTLGGATEQIQTQLNSNTTAYRYYRLLGVSGALSSSPYLYELIFKILTESNTNEYQTFGPMMWVF